MNKRKLISMLGILVLSTMISAASRAGTCEDSLRALHPDESKSLETFLLSESIYNVPKTQGEATIAVTEGGLCIFKGAAINPANGHKEPFFRVLHLVNRAFNVETNESQNSHIEDVRWDSNVESGNPNPAIRAVSQKINENDLTLYLEKKFENGLTIRYIVEKRATALAYASATYKLFGILPRLNVIHNDEYLIR